MTLATAPARFFCADNERSFARNRRHGLHLVSLGGGRGRPLVLLHGLGSCLQDLTPLATRLAATRRCILVDLPGFGGSLGPACETVTEVAERVLEALSLMGIERAAWLGASFGGQVALRAARLAPERISSLILMASGGLLREVPASLAEAYREEVMAARSPEAVAAACRALVAAPNAETEAFTQRRLVDHAEGDYRAIARSARAAIADTVGQELEQVACPALLIHGRADPLIPFAIAREAADRLPRAELVSLDAGHMPWLERPAEAARAILERRAALEPQPMNLGARASA